eukprot:UN21722
MQWIPREHLWRNIFRTHGGRYMRPETCVYQCPSGFHWMTHTEYFQKVQESTTCQHEWIYHFQCGWGSLSWQDGPSRVYFRFQDSEPNNVNGWALHAGLRDFDIQNGEPKYNHDITDHDFAGIVCAPDVQQTGHKRENNCESQNGWALMNFEECSQYAAENNMGFLNQQLEELGQYNHHWEADCRTCITDGYTVGFNRHANPSCSSHWLTICKEASGEANPGGVCSQDTCGGIRESTCGGIFYVPDYSTDDATWDPDYDYQCPSGYVWMTSTEYTTRQGESTTCEDEKAYHDQCGWSGYDCDLIHRRYFRFKDSDATNGWSAHSGNQDNTAVTVDKVLTQFAGLVCAKDSCADVVCEALDDCHDAGDCFEGGCTDIRKADGSECTGGTCQSGVCEAGGAALLEDSCGGFRESTCGGIYFAAVQTNGDWNPEYDYKCPAGYSWMTKPEYEAKKDASATCSSAEYVGYNQCGWNEYTFDGVRRNYFRFKDTDMETHAWALHAGAFDSQEVQDAKQSRLFAGIVCGEAEENRVGEGFRPTSEGWCPEGYSLVEEKMWHQSKACPGSLLSSWCIIPQSDVREFCRTFHEEGGEANGGRRCWVITEKVNSGWTDVYGDAVVIGTEANVVERDPDTNSCVWDGTWSEESVGFTPPTETETAIGAEPSETSAFTLLEKVPHDHKIALVLALTI